MSNTIPPDKAQLRLLLVSGQTKEVLVDPNQTVSSVISHLHDTWPQGNSLTILFLIFLK